MYEGINHIKKDILEDEVTSPVLSYAKSKDYNEKQRTKFRKELCHIKTGSVYGYSTDTMRLELCLICFQKYPLKMVFKVIFRRKAN